MFAKIIKAVLLGGVLFVSGLWRPSVSVASSSASTPTGSDENHHVGNLVLWGNQEIVVDGTTFYQKGDMELHGHARLVVRNGGVFNFDQDYHEEYKIELYDYSEIIVDGGVMKSPNRYSVTLFGKNKVVLNRAVVDEGGAIWETHGTGAMFHAVSSHIDMLYLSYPFVGGGRVRNDTVIIEGGKIDQLSPDFDQNVQVTLEGWKQGKRISAHLLSQETNLPYDITLSDVYIGFITGWSRGKAKVTLKDCHLSQFRPDEQSQLVIVDSHIDQLVPSFDRLRGEIVIRGWRPGHFDEWAIDLRKYGGYTLRINNSLIDAFVVRPFDVHLRLIDCDIELLRPFWNAHVVVENSRIHSLWFWDYWGTTIFNNVVVGDLEDIRMYPQDPRPANFWIKGNVVFEKATLVIAGMGEQWLQTVVHREYPVRVMLNGEPVKGVFMRVTDPNGKVVWQGKTSEDGAATFSLAFTKETRRSPGTLLVQSENGWIEVPVYLYTSTPIEVDISPPTPTPTVTLTPTLAPSLTPTLTLTPVALFTPTFTPTLQVTLTPDKAVFNEEASAGSGKYLGWVVLMFLIGVVLGIWARNQVIK